MYCSQCGTQLQEDQEVCPACDARVGKRKRGFWQRLLGFLGTPVSSTTTVIKEEKIVFLNEKTGTRTVFNSFDELPPEIKSKFEQAKEGKLLVFNSFDELSFTVRSSEGNEETYHSLEEMPPDVRAIYEKDVPPEIRGQIENQSDEKESPHDSSPDSDYR